MNENKPKLTIQASEVAIANLKEAITSSSNMTYLKVRHELVPTLDKTILEYVDEYGNVQMKSISATLFVDMLEIAKDRIIALSRMHWLGDITVFDFAQNCTNIEGYGDKKIKLLCALIFGCDRKLSMFITINSNILEKGLISKKTESGISKTEGHTIWDKDELEFTVAEYVKSDKGKLDVKVERIIQTLLESKTLTLKSNKYFLTCVANIDKIVAESVMMSTDLHLNMPASDNLTQDQFNVLKNIASDGKKVSILYGPGGTGKTYAIAKLILANKDMLCEF